MRLFVMFVCLIVSIGCEKRNKVKTEAREPQFSTSEASRLFFRNVRSIFYEKEVLQANKMEVYRLKKRNRNPDAPAIHLAIANNWLYDEAYLLLEPSSAMPDLVGLPFFITHIESGKRDTIYLSRWGKEEAVSFGKLVDNAIVEESIIEFLSKDGDLVKLSDLESFHVVVHDYKNLLNDTSR